MASTIRKHLYIVILKLAHLLWAAYIQSKLHFTLFYYYLRSSFTNSQKSNHQDTDVYKNIKLPRHLAFCLTNENSNFDLSSLVNLIIWSKQVGINYITLYDDHGKLGRRQDLLEDMLVERVGEPVKGVRILSRSDSRPKFLNIIRNISSLPKEKVDLNLINEEVSNSDKCPQVELLIIFGIASCVYEFPPWHLKNAEIFKLITHRKLPMERFLECLKQYASVQQRVGV